MSCYNEYLHHDFKELGFPDYIKMLDREQRLANFNFLTTQEKLPEPPFFDKYAADIRFTIINPAEETGKRPYIGLIQSTLLDSKRAGDEAVIISRQLYYPPFPDRRQIKADITRCIEGAMRSQIGLPASSLTPDFNPSTNHHLRTGQHTRR